MTHQPETAGEAGLDRPAPASPVTASDGGVDAPVEETHIQEIVPGLYRLRTPMTSSALPWIMPYAFLAEGGVTLFDSGFGTPEASEALTVQLAALGYEPSDVRRMIVSHAHPDHLGMAHWLREQAPDYELILLDREAEWFDDVRSRPGNWFDRNNAWLVRHGMSPEELEAQAAAERAREREREEASSTDPAADRNRRSWAMTHVTPDRRLRDGEVIEFDGWRLQAVWTPGHTPGHLCLYELNHRLTFTGDHVLSRITPHVGYSQDDEAAGRNPLRDFRASLEKTAALDTALALPAHEELIEDLPARCHAIIEHHDHRLEEILDALGGGRTAAFDLAAAVTWNKPWSTFNLHKQRMALGETAAHLELLRTQDRVRRIEADDRVLWERV